jgi:hypothetical protein
MEKFIQVFRDEIGRISLDKIEEEIGEIYDGEGISLPYAGLNNSRWERILNRCRLYFDKVELEAVRRFIEENCNPPDVLSIQIERRISIIPFAVEGLQDKEETGEEMETPSIVISKKGF